MKDTVAFFFVGMDSHAEHAEVEKNKRRMAIFVTTILQHNKTK